MHRRNSKRLIFSALGENEYSFKIGCGFQQTKPVSMNGDLSTATHIFRQVIIGSGWSLEKCLQPLTLLQGCGIAYGLFYFYSSTLHVILSYHNYLTVRLWAPHTSLVIDDEGAA